jgi:hypothetical protein
VPDPHDVVPRRAKVSRDGSQSSNQINLEWVSHDEDIDDVALPA